MRKPPSAAARGLNTIAGIVMAGTSDDLLGFDYELANAEERKRWDDVEAAVQWIRQHVHEENSRK